MQEFLKLLKESLPDAIGGVISAAVIALGVVIYSYPQCQDHKVTKISDIDTG
jgi:hypothetical protein